MEIVILDGYTENPGDLSWGGFEALGGVTVYDRTPFLEGNQEIIKRAKGAEAVILNKTSMSSDTIKALLPELKYIGVLATGFNVVDIDAAKKNGIVVCNIPSYGTTAVAQFAMALTLELCHRVGDHSISVKNGDWSGCKDFTYWNTPLIELKGKTFGVIGYGKIGRATAELASAFGMDIVAYDQYAEKDSLAKMVSLDELLSQSNVISLHCPLTPETEGIINSKTIDKMKDKVMLINTSRGSLIVEEDLVKALNSGKIAGAGLDVLTKEPPDINNPLLKCENCIITPHIAWAPKESRQRLMDTAVSNLESYIKKTPQNVVNQ